MGCFSDQGDATDRNAGWQAAGAQKATQDAQALAAAALEEQRKAREAAAEIAAAGEGKTEQARKRAERRIRQLTDNQGFGAPPAGQASIGYRVAMGA